MNEPESYKRRLKKIQKFSVDKNGSLAQQQNHDVEKCQSLTDLRDLKGSDKTTVATNGARSQDLFKLHVDQESMKNNPKDLERMGDFPELCGEIRKEIQAQVHTAIESILNEMMKRLDKIEKKVDSKK